MATAASAQHQSLLFSSAELSYLRTSLSSPAENRTIRTQSKKQVQGSSEQEDSGLALVPSLVVRPDARSPTTFRPLTAETGVLPLTNGSARVCLADGSEAVVGVKADVEEGERRRVDGDGDGDGDGEGEEMVIGGEQGKTAGLRPGGEKKKARRKGTVVVNVDVPGFRDDDALPTYLAEMIKEGVVGGGELEERLGIRRRFAWKIYIDILLLHSPPLSYPLPLLSLATHLALLDTRLPALISDTSSALLKPNTSSKSNYINPIIEDEDDDDDDDDGDGDQDEKNDDNDNEDDDPLFADDWGLAEPLFPSSLSVAAASSVSRKMASSGLKKLPPSPPVTLLVMAVDESIIFDPSAQELAVADGVLAVTVGYKDTVKNITRRDGGNKTTSGSSSNSSNSSGGSNSNSSSSDSSSTTSSESNTDQKSKTQTSGANPKPSDRRAVRLISVRTIDPPSRLTHSGLPNALNPATGGTAVPPAHADLVVAKERLLAEKAAAGANGDDGSAGKGDHGGVWTPPRGGLSRKVVKRMVDEVIRRGGVGEEVLEALEGVVVGGGVGES